MKIALLGYGKMGKLIEQQARERGHEISTRFSKSLGDIQGREEEIKYADIAIDFSQAEFISKHVQICLQYQKSIVIGTTGWESDYQEIEQQIKQNPLIGCLYSPNFSIGCYLFQKLAEYAGSLFQPFSEYEVHGLELHHKHKKDAPSGTAKAIINRMQVQMPRMPVNFTSIRAGFFPGTHTLLFDSPIDTIQITHEARSREGFALGAILAAEWLINQKGFFTMDQMMDSLLKEKK